MLGVLEIRDDDVRCRSPADGGRHATRMDEIAMDEQHATGSANRAGSHTGLQYRDPSLIRPRAAAAGWQDVDVRALDTIRLLAADAVQKVGNGHPGTAMSLAPLAYLLFQQVMVHDPADDQWLGRDRFVLSAGHSSLTLYIQLYLSGYGLELADLEALRTWGSKTPGHPEYRHTRGVEITTGPLGQGLSAAVGMAMGARRERGLLDPDAEPGRARSTTTSTSSPPTATSWRA